MADKDQFGRSRGNTIKDIAPGPMFNDWYGYKSGKTGSITVRPGNESKDIRAHDFLTGGGSPGLGNARVEEFYRPLGPYDYLQNREDPQLQEFDLMQAIRDRMLRGQ